MSLQLDNPDQREYSDNVMIVGDADDQRSLPNDMWFATMKVDPEGKFSRPREDYWDFKHGELGLVSATDGRIRISKLFHTHDALEETKVVIVQVADKAKCIVDTGTLT